MQRKLPLALVFLAAASSAEIPTQAQDPVAAAAREEAAENYRTALAKISRLEEELHSNQARLVKLTDEIYKMREELDRQKSRNENAATLDKITRLQEAIKQVDDARLEDNKKVMSEIAKIQRTTLEKLERTMKNIGPATAPPPTSNDEPRRPDPSTRPTKAPPENSYKYTIKKGDTLSGIASALRVQGYKVSARQIEDANPGVNWNRLGVGREIIIPPPSPQ